MKKDSRQTNQDEAESQRPTSDGESFGAWLCRQRTVRGIELQEIAESSKISLAYLKAFESDRFDILPADVFAKGFLRQYANYVGLDPEEVINFFLAASHGEEDDEDPEPRHPNGSGGSTGRLIVLSMLLVAALVAIVWWLARQQAAVGAPGGAAPTEATSSSRGSAAAETPSRPQPAASGAPSTDGDEVETVDGGQGGASESGLSADEIADVDGTSGGDTGAASEASTTVATASGSAFSVVAEFSDSCWVEAIVDGERQVSITKVQGESLLLQAEDAIDFIFGNVNAVRLEVDGQPYPLTPRRGTSRLAVRIDRDALSAQGSAAPLANGDGGATP